jgi:transcriptional regulator with XRE-family HTH domain
MSRWKELPTELHPHVRQLVVRLRRLKDHGGLNMRQLAAKTGYSAKSWERYLNGRSLPPREAVEAMARIAGDEPTRLLALHEVAADRWREARGAVPAGSAGMPTAPLPEPEPEPEPEEGPSRGRSRRVALVAGTVTLVLAAAAFLVPAVWFTGTHGSGDGDGDGRAVAASPPAASAASRSPATYTCRVERVDGRWYAGNSRTREAILAYGHAGPEVAEAQCLLHRAGLSPGEIDGIYGPLTQRAVKRVQKRDGLVVDGIVGPHTWKALREMTPT